MEETHGYPANTGTFAQLKDEEKRKRLDAMVQLWQRETERHLSDEQYPSYATSLGLDEYRYAVWLRFPEWERSVVVGQVVTVPSTQGKPQPLVFSTWRRENLLQTMPDWKLHLPKETVFNIAVRLTPGGLGEGSKWAIIMPKELIPRYKPGWPTQQDWVSWTNSFDWLSVAVGFVRTMLDTK